MGSLPLVHENENYILDLYWPAITPDGLDAFFYITKPEAKTLCAHFGFPDYFRIELAVAKVIGIAVLLLGRGRIREWAYAGFTIVIISGVIAHCCSGDGFPVSALLAVVILGVSYYSFLHLQHDAPTASSYRSHQQGN